METKLAKKNNQELKNISQGIIEFHEHLLHELDNLSDLELDEKIEFSCTIDEAAWLIRARCFDIKLNRMRDAGVKITPNKLANDLSKQFGRHKDTWSADWKLLKHFGDDFFYLLPKEIYRVAAKAPARIRLQLLNEATDQRAANNFSLKTFTTHARREGNKFRKRKTTKDKSGKLINEFVSEAAFINLGKLMKGPKNGKLAGHVTRRQALENAINSAAYQMMQCDARNLNLDITDVEPIRKEVK